jgi:hypothetical protein
MLQATLSDEQEQQLRAEFEKAGQKVGENTFENSHKLVVDMGAIPIHFWTASPSTRRSRRDTLVRFRSPSL